MGIVECKFVHCIYNDQPLIKATDGLRLAKGRDPVKDRKLLLINQHDSYEYLY